MVLDGGEGRKKKGGTKKVGGRKKKGVCQVGGSSRSHETEGPV